MIEARYELLRMSCMRVVWALVVVAVVTGPAMALAMIAMSRDAASPEDFPLGATSATTVAMTRGPFAITVSVLLGILVASRDLRRGASGTTPVLFPRRGRLFSARLSVVGIGSAGIAAATVTLSAGASALMMPSDASVDAAVVARVAVMFVLAQVCFAIIGAALALLTGSAGAAAAIAFGWILIVEPGMRLAVTVSGHLGGVTEYLPTTAANIMVHSLMAGSATNETTLLSANPATATLALVGVTTALVVWAWVVFRSRALARR